MSDGPSGICVTPHLIGACNPHWNARASTAVVGLTPSSDIFSLYKGILEGIACEFDLNADALAQATGAFSRVRIYGGGAGSRFGLRLRAALSGRTVETLRQPPRRSAWAPRSSRGLRRASTVTSRTAWCRRSG